MIIRPARGVAGSAARRPPANSRVPSANVAYLTADGRRMVEERMGLLEATVAELEDALRDPECPPEIVEGYYRARGGLARLRALLESAEILDDVPDDPQVVELGDCVSIRLDDGAEETYLIVQAPEATVDDYRISSDSPLGRALLTRRVGETVDVAVPAGSYRCTILSATRGHGRATAP